MNLIKNKYSVVGILLSCSLILSIICLLCDITFIEYLSLKPLFLQLLWTMPIVLLVVFFFKPKFRPLFTISFGVYSVLYLYDLITMIINNDIYVVNVIMIYYIIPAIIFIFTAFLFVDCIIKHKLFKVGRFFTSIMLATNSFCLIRDIVYFSEFSNSEINMLIRILPDVSNIIVSFAYCFYYFQLIGKPLFKEKVSPISAYTDKPENFEEELLQLKTLFNNSQISEDEYNSKRSQIINRL